MHQGQEGQHLPTAGPQGVHECDQGQALHIDHCLAQVGQLYLCKACGVWG